VRNPTVTGMRYVCVVEQINYFDLFCVTSLICCWNYLILRIV